MNLSLSVLSVLGRGGHVWLYVCIHICTHASKSDISSFHAILRNTINLLWRRIHQRLAQAHMVISLPMSMWSAVGCVQITIINLEVTCPRGQYRHTHGWGGQREHAALVQLWNALIWNSQKIMLSLKDRAIKTLSYQWVVGSWRPTSLKAT